MSDFETRNTNKMAEMYNPLFSFLMSKKYPHSLFPLKTSFKTDFKEIHRVKKKKHK